MQKVLQNRWEPEGSTEHDAIGVTVPQETPLIEEALEPAGGAAEPENSFFSRLFNR